MSENNKIARRDFLKQLSAIGILGAVVAAGIGGATYLGAHDTLQLRPPGAVNEDDFLALCIKCGQCLQVCPYDSILLADVGSGHGVGTPYIDAANRGCYLCPLLPCVLACPSGALDHHLEDVKKVEMGVAVVSDMQACIARKSKPVTREMIHRIFDHTNTLSAAERSSYVLETVANPSDKRELEEKVLKKLEAFEGKACTLCADMCPLPNALEAITMVDDDDGGKRPLILSACVGCGVCVEMCPTSVLEIKPRVSYNAYYKKG